MLIYIAIYIKDKQNGIILSLIFVFLVNLQNFAPLFFNMDRIHDLTSNFEFNIFYSLELSIAFKFNYHQPLHPNLLLSLARSLYLCPDLPPPLSILRPSLPDRKSVV